MMKFADMLDAFTDAFAAVPLGGRRSDPRLSELDRGVLEVALLIAMLDGSVLPDEMRAFQRLMQGCRGYSAKRSRAYLDEMLHRAGYLLAIAQVPGYTVRDRLDAFVASAIEVLPNGFLDGSIADVRRAFALWIAMAVSDGEYSGIERQAIMLLRDRFTEIKLNRQQNDEARWLALSPAFTNAYSKLPRTRKIKFLEDDFLEKVERIVLDLAVPAKRAKAETALSVLIGTVIFNSSASETPRSASACEIRLRDVSTH